MKRIFFSILTVVLVLVAVGGAVYAIYTNKGQVKGLTMTTGNADLKIGATGKSGDGCVSDGSGGKLCDSINNYGTISDMYPGFLVGDYFRLKNTSDSEISMNVTATLASYANTSGFSGSWAALKSTVQGRILEYNSRDDAWWAYENQDYNWTKVSESTNWHSLEWWANNTPGITGSSIGPDEERHFVLWIRLVDSAGNEVADKSVDLELELTGNQEI